MPYESLHPVDSAPDADFNRKEHHVDRANLNVKNSLVEQIALYNAHVDAEATRLGLTREEIILAEQEELKSLGVEAFLERHAQKQEGDKE